MTTVTVSPKFQVVIPREIRERLRLKPGQKLQAMAFEGRIQLIPVLKARDLRGAFKGLNTEIEREGDRV